MAENDIPMEEDQKLSLAEPIPSTSNIQKHQTPNAQATTARQSNQIDLREMSIILDGWSRTCDTVLNTLSDQLTKIARSNSEKS